MSQVIRHTITGTVCDGIGNVVTKRTGDTRDNWFMKNITNGSEGGGGSEG